MKDYTKTIDGVEYTTKTLTATRGLVILPKLIALFGQAVLEAVFSKGEALKDPGVLKAVLQDPAVIGRILAHVAQSAAETDGLLVLKDLLVATEADKVRIGDTEVPANVSKHFDSHFAGRYMHLLSVCMWVATCNFIEP